jgi:glutamine amidotransferase
VCRFTFYQGHALGLGALITEPHNSLIHQSFHSQERKEPLNGDGFGVAWYAPDYDEPALFRSLTPAWSNRNLRELARVVRSTCVLAHVRAASHPLEVSESNCHPFKSGRYTFMHNGHVGGFEDIRRALIDSLSERAFRAVRGNTDTEHLFAVFLDEVEKAGTEPADPEAMAVLLERAVHRVLRLTERHAPGEPSDLNLVLSDGRSSVACRLTTAAPETAASLHLHYGRRYVCEGRVCRMVDPEEGAGAVLVSSERLSEDPGWQTVPVGHLVTVGPDLHPATRPMKVG